MQERVAEHGAKLSARFKRQRVIAFESVARGFARLGDIILAFSVHEIIPPAEGARPR